MEQQYQQEIARFAIMVKETKGNTTALDSLVATVLDAKSAVYSFSEAIDILPLGYCSASSTSGWGRILYIFAYGIYSDYVKEQCLPALSVGQSEKLKQLTILSLAMYTDTLSYGDLMNALHLSTVRELEDLLIDGIYKGLYKGILRHVDQMFCISSGIGRDSQSLESCLALMSKWKTKCKSVLDVLDQTITQAQLPDGQGVDIDLMKFMFALNSGTGNSKLGDAL